MFAEKTKQRPVFDNKNILIAGGNNFLNQMHLLQVFYYIQKALSNTAYMSALSSISPPTANSK